MLRDHMLVSTKLLVLPLCVNDLMLTPCVHVTAG